MRATLLHDMLSLGTRKASTTDPESKEHMVRGHDVSDDAHGSGREWRRSSRSYGTGNCLEVGARGERVDIRDSKHPHGALLRFAPAQWMVFITSVRNGKLGF